MALPKVTVLVPVYDGAPYVPATIESVLAQTFTDFELLLIDDASSDESAVVIGSYSDPRIRLLRNERNLGQVGTVNRGLHEARGEYVARLDQDDRCAPQRLERQVEVLDAEPRVAVVGGWVDAVDEHGRVVERVRGTIADFAEFIALLLVHDLPIAHSAATFRREEVLALGGYDATYRLAEDMDLWRRVALRRRDARVVPEVLVRYLVHEGQQSRQRYAEQLENSVRSLDVFVGELSGRAPASALRRLLMLDASLTEQEIRRAAESFAPFLEDAARRLELDEQDAGKLERLLRRRVYTGAMRSWRNGIGSFRRTAVPLVRFGLAAETLPSRVLRAAAFAAVFTASPLLSIARRLKRGAHGRRRYHPEP